MPLDLCQGTVECVQKFVCATCGSACAKLRNRITSLQRSKTLQDTIKIVFWCQVICVDNFFTGSKENVAHLLGKTNFELIRHDVVEKLLLEVDQIYHLACPASPVHYKCAHCHFQHKAFSAAGASIICIKHVLHANDPRAPANSHRDICIRNTLSRYCSWKLDMSARCRQEGSCAPAVTSRAPTTAAACVHGFAVRTGTIPSRPSRPALLVR